MTNLEKIKDKILPYPKIVNSFGIHVGKNKNTLIIHTEKARIEIEDFVMYFRITDNANTEIKIWYEKEIPYKRIRNAIEFM